MSHRSVGLVALAALSLVFAVLGCREDKGTNPTPASELGSPALLGATSGSQNYLYTFVSAGTYPYHCNYHTTLSHREAGAVIVADGGQDSPLSPSSRAPTIPRA